MVASGVADKVDFDFVVVGVEVTKESLLEQ